MLRKEKNYKAKLDLYIYKYRAFWYFRKYLD